MSNTDNKGLQKFTDLKTPAQVREYLHGKTAEDCQELIMYYAEELDRGEGASLESHELQELIITTAECAAMTADGMDKVEEAKRKIWDMNHAAIARYIMEEVQDGRMPTITAVAENTGLSRTTVYNHINHEDGLLPDLIDTEVNKYRQLVPSAIGSLYRIGVGQGNVSALKAFISLLYQPTAERPTEGRMPPIVGMQIIDSNIQINNLSLTQEDIENLPPETLVKVEELIAQALKQ